MRLHGGHGVRVEVRVLGRIFASQRFQLLVRQQHGIGVVAQTARVVEDDMLKRRTLLAHLDHLVDLFLVLDDRNADLRILQHVDHFLRDGVLIERNRNRTERLRGHHGHVQTRAILADNGHVHAGLDAKRCETLRDVTDMLRHFGPGQGLPDPQVFLSYRGPRPTNVGMREQQRRKGVRRRRHLCRCGR